ncbi:MAG TPA: hypothetical protein VK434_02880 [Microvirga sp.]|jgi:hypothetical protein|nr:hypothetical protein [Microvirga sp.]
MSIGRFVVLHHRGEWLVTYGNSDPAAFTTREEAESSAFSAADTLALNGHPVSVVILPEGLDAGPEDYGAMRERLSVSKAL